VRAGPNLSKPFNLICPVQPRLQKYFRSRLSQIKSISSLSHPLQGRIAVVTDAGWDAVDAAVLGARIARDEQRLLRTAKPCGPGAPMLALSFAELSAR
jgi:hypothetical protein